MKSFCPHCNQEFPELPDSYLGMTLECPTCNNQFVCEKAKFCSECGAVNPAKAIKCSRCGAPFLVMPRIPPQMPPPVPPAPVPGQSPYGAGTPNPSYTSGYYSRSTYRISSAENLTWWVKTGMNWCIVQGLFLSPLSAVCILIAYFFGAPIFSDLPAIYLAPIVFFAIVNPYGAYLFSLAKDPLRKIYWTPYRKAALITFCIFNFFSGLASSIYYLMSDTPQGSLILFPLSICGCCGSISGWNLFNTRAAEDVDFEESAEDISADRLHTLLRMTTLIGVFGLIPVMGIPFAVIAGIMLGIYKLRGGSEHGKAVILVGIGLAVQAVVGILALAAK